MPMASLAKSNKGLEVEVEESKFRVILIDRLLLMYMSGGWKRNFRQLARAVCTLVQHGPTDYYFSSARHCFTCCAQCTCSSQGRAPNAKHSLWPTYGAHILLIPYRWKRFRWKCDLWEPLRPYFNRQTN